MAVPWRSHGGPMAVQSRGSPMPVQSRGSTVMAVSWQSHVSHMSVPYQCHNNPMPAPCQFHDSPTAVSQHIHGTTIGTTMTVPRQFRGRFVPHGSPIEAHEQTFMKVYGAAMGKMNSAHESISHGIAMSPPSRSVRLSPRFFSWLTLRSAPKLLPQQQQRPINISDKQGPFLRPRLACHDSDTPEIGPLSSRHLPR